MKKFTNFFKDMIWKPKNLYSIDHLKYLYDVLCSNRIVDRYNREVLVEVFKEIPEVIIWGDQNDPKIFEFFSTNNMILFFIIIIRQKCGAPLTYQILQALNIIIENIRVEENLYYILSNNNMNIIITSNYNTHLDEILALYMSLLKILSIRLNAKNVDFLFDYVNNDFPILTEALNFYDHKENMIRINVRNIFLNVFKLRNPNIDKYILHTISDVYFSQIFWKLRSLILAINQLVNLSKYSLVLPKIRPNIDELCDILQYINDLLAFVSVQIYENLIHNFIHNFFCKFLWFELLDENENCITFSESNQNLLAKSNSKKSIYKFVLYYVIAQIIINTPHIEIKKKILKFYFKSAKPDVTKNKDNNFFVWTTPISINEHLNTLGIVKRNYNIEERIEMFITKIIGVELNSQDNLSLSDSPPTLKHIEQVKDNHLGSRHLDDPNSHLTIDPSILITECDSYFTFDSENNFLINLHENLNDDRNTYFSLNLFLQILNAIDEQELNEFLQQNTENFIHDHLELLLKLIKNLISNQNKFRTITIHLIFFIIHFLIKRFQIVRTVIRKSSFTNDLKTLSIDCATILSHENNQYLPRVFLFHLLEIQNLKLSPQYFNHVYSVFLPCECEELLSSYSSASFSSDNGNFCNKLSIYLLLTITLSIVEEMDPLERFSDILAMTKPPFLISTSIHSADHDIAACALIVGNKSIGGFLVFSENHLAFSVPAPHPQYGSLTVKFLWSFSMIKIVNSKDPVSTSYYIHVYENFPYNSNKLNSKKKLKLTFATTYSMNTIYEKLSTKLRIFNKSFNKILNYKLNLTFNCVENEQEGIFDDSTSISSFDRNNSASRMVHQPSMLSDIIKNIL